MGRPNQQKELRMKVGILTWYEVLNYGSAFQAYALQKQVESLGHEAVMLRHDRPVPDYCGNSLKSANPQAILQWLRCQTPGCRRYRNETKKKLTSFDAFRSEWLNVGERYDVTDADCVLIGSDQIFDINGLYYPFQFGGGVSCSKIGTYAPCFGETTYERLIDSEHKDEICELIGALSCLNARDKNTQQILERITGKQIPMTIDPVLLYPFEEEKKVWNRRLIDDKFCLIYTWGGTTTSAEFAEKCTAFARNNGLKLVSVGEPRVWCDIQYSSASPIEFFELFMHADMVLTNMFHGTCFSILMGRPFYSFVMPHNENKLGGLLRYVGLESQLVNTIDELPESIPTIDYASFNKKLSTLRDESKSILVKAINN